jgi:hypothetical protein
VGILGTEFVCFCNFVIQEYTFLAEWTNEKLSGAINGDGIAKSTRRVKGQKAKTARY